MHAKHNHLQSNNEPRQDVTWDEARSPSLRNEHGSTLTFESLTHPEEATRTECISVLSP